jgi:histidine ammonia-lyase
MPEHVILDGRSLTPAEVAAVARDGRPVRVHEAARARNAAAAEALAAVVDEGTPVYGVTTGVGAFRARAVPPRDRADHQLRLLRSHACGAGRPLPVDQVRAAMAVRANQICAGGAGVSDELLEALVAALNAGVVPFARELGSLGTGDVTVLAEIALALLGEGRAWRDGAAVPARAVLEDAGLTTPALGVRDGHAFTSSNAAAIGHGALVAADARRMTRASLAVAALSFMAAGADPVVFDARVHAARAHRGQAAVAGRMRELIGDRPDRGRAVVHDPFPFRTLAQVEGTALDALEDLERVLAVELNAAAENSLLAPDPPTSLPGGNFHAGSLALALDRLRAALAQSSSLAASRVSALLDPGLMGLPAALAERPGSDSGAMILEYTAHAAAAEVRLLATPVSAQTTVVGGGIESHASFAPHAARRAQEALDAAAVVGATELVIAVRGLRMRGRTPAATPAAELYEAAAERLDPDLGDRALADDIEAARLLLLEPAAAWP